MELLSSQHGSCWWLGTSCQGICSHHVGARKWSELTGNQHPRYQGSWGPNGAHLGPVVPRWAPCWPHEPCYQGYWSLNTMADIFQRTFSNAFPWLTVSMTFQFKYHSCLFLLVQLTHYSDVIMGAMASQITRLTIVYSTVYSGTDQRKHKSSASLAFMRGIHRGPVNSQHNWPVTRKMFPFDDVIMHISALVEVMVYFGVNQGSLY